MGIRINGQNDTITATDGSITVGTNLTVPGTLTYEDVTNIDSVGLITARSGVNITDGGLVVVGVTTVSAGSASVPSISPSGDPDTGLYSPGDDQLALATGGSGRLFIDSSGRLGVGTAAPADTNNFGNALDVNGTAGSAVYVRTNGSATDFGMFGHSGTTAYVINQSNGPLTMWTNNSEKLRIDSSGRLLVGTSSNRTNFALQLEGTNYNQASLSLTNNQNTGNSGYVYLTKTRGTAVGSNTIVNDGDPLGIVEFAGADGSNLVTAAKIEARVDGTPDANDMPGRLTFHTTAVGASTPTERMRIDSSGSLLIGTSTTFGTSSADLLQVSHIFGGRLLLQRDKTNITTNEEIGSVTWYSNAGNVQPGGSISCVADGAHASNDKPSRLQFSTTADGASSPTERVRIDSSGRVGIGTMSPTEPLHVDGSAVQALFRGTGDSNGGIRIRPSGTAVYSQIYFDNAAGTSSAGITCYGGISLYIDSSSNGDIFHRTNGTGAHIWSVNSGALEAARIDSSGRLLVGTSNSRAVGSSAGFPAKLQIESSGYTNTSFVQNTNDTFGPEINLGKSRGASAGSNTAVQSGDQLGIIQFAGADGTDLETNAAAIECLVDGTVGINSMPGRLVFSTTADGASIPTLRLTIKRDGTFIFDNTTDLIPETDNVTNLGKSGHRWTAVWAANGTIQTSDERAKSNIAESSLGSDFIKSLRPVSYKWIEGGKRDTGERDEDNNYIYESVPGTRTHWGFIAQEVKQAVDDAGVDFGGWVLTDKDDPDSQQALRYDQFIAPLTKALQETMAELEDLKAEVASLKGA